MIGILNQPKAHGCGQVRPNPPHALGLGSVREGETLCFAESAARQYLRNLNKIFELPKMSEIIRNPRKSTKSPHSKKIAKYKNSIEYRKTEDNRYLHSRRHFPIYTVHSSWDCAESTITSYITFCRKSFALCKPVKLSKIL